MKTINDYLKSGAIDIAPLLSLVLDKNSAQLMIDGDQALSEAQATQLNQLIEQRQQGVPFAYLSGKKGFYHLEFTVTPDTLIPRPETELLIEVALDLFPDQQAVKMLDLGTGPGTIAITLADQRPDWQVSAVDVSAGALAVAKQNVTRPIEFLQGSWFEPVADQRFDLIVSNPPYVEENDPHLLELTHEPISALTSGVDGLDDIRRIIDQAPAYLNPGGYLLLEHGFDQQDRIVQLLAKNFVEIKRFKDYNDKDRAVLARIG